MDRRTFGLVCELLQSRGLKARGSLAVEEQVCMFLHTLSHHVKNRIIGSRFFRSGETVNRYFNSVLNGVLQLHDVLLRVSDPVPENCTDERRKVHVLENDKPRYRARKGEIATNVLGVCSRDMKFIFVMPGWEGFASNSRVLRDALNKSTGLKVPTGYYYLVDAGYTNAEGFFIPYKGTGYHLSEWRDGCAPRNKKEFFNMKHSSTRNVIERCFGLLKMRWAILRNVVVANGGRADNDTFKSGSYKYIENELEKLLPGSGLKAYPHIKFKIRIWKKSYAVIFDMLNTSSFDM
ncbi:DDE Tnp4 domain-containing protein [Citrus sinensis]|uniref:DDE Tnp4 domain-containing protein n=1 Tax=Citrus sinensis TaxID=2711 RepID=A0ACB8N344_CITSI|nr:DDE Tnp4 domain-containing protein [Citrus sinensis]